MNRHAKQDGSITLQGQDGRIIGNVPGKILSGPGDAPVVQLDVAEAKQVLNAGAPVTASLALAENGAWVAQHDDAYRAEYGNWRADIWGFSLDEIARTAPNTPVEKRAEVADYLAARLDEEYEVHVDDQHWEPQDIPGMDVAMSRWAFDGVDGINNVLDSTINANIAPRQCGDRDAETVGRLADMLDVDGETAFEIFAEVCEQYGDNWTYDTDEFLESKRGRYGIVDGDRHDFRDCVNTLRDSLGAEGEVIVDSLEQFDKITALLPEGGIHLHFPRAIRLTDKGRAELSEWLEGESDSAWCDEVRYQVGLTEGGVS